MLAFVSSNENTLFEYTAHDRPQKILSLSRVRPLSSPNEPLLPDQFFFFNRAEISLFTRDEMITRDLKWKCYGYSNLSQKSPTIILFFFFISFAETVNKMPIV